MTVIRFMRYDESCNEPPFTAHKVGQYVTVNDVAKIEKEDTTGSAVYNFLNAYAASFGFRMKFWNCDGPIFVVFVE